MSTGESCGMTTLLPYPKMRLREDEPLDSPNKYKLEKAIHFLNHLILNNFVPVINGSNYWYPFTIYQASISIICHLKPFRLGQKIERRCTEPTWNQDKLQSGKSA